jgi:hypothetical protein
MEKELDKKRIWWTLALLAVVLVGLAISVYINVFAPAPLDSYEEHNWPQELALCYKRLDWAGIRKIFAEAIEKDEALLNRIETETKNLKEGLDPRRYPLTISAPALSYLSSSYVFGEVVRRVAAESEESEQTVNSLFEWFVHELDVRQTSLEERTRPLGPDSLLVRGYADVEGAAWCFAELVRAAGYHAWVIAFPEKTIESQPENKPSSRTILLTGVECKGKMLVYAPSMGIPLYVPDTDIIAGIRDLLSDPKPFAEMKAGDADSPLKGMDIQRATILVPANPSALLPATRWIEEQLKKAQYVERFHVPPLWINLDDELDRAARLIWGQQTITEERMTSTKTGRALPEDEASVRLWDFPFHLYRGGRAMPAIRIDKKSYPRSKEIIAGRQLQASGLPQEAVKIFKKIHDDTTRLPAERTEAVYFSAVCEWEQENYKPALKHINEYFELESDDIWSPPARLLQGEVLLKLNREEDAEDAFAGVKGPRAFRADYLLRVAEKNDE